MLRFNGGGKFNLPVGNVDFNKNVVAALNEYFNFVRDKKIIFSSKDFRDFFLGKKYFKNDFVYFDPPYHPISKTANFTNYTKLDFTEEDQIRLNNVYSSLDKKDIYVMLSNSTAPLITQLYSNYNTLTVKAKRMINCKADKRGPVSEIVALNYK